MRKLLSSQVFPDMEGRGESNSRTTEKYDFTANYQMQHMGLVTYQGKAFFDEAN